jgi:hypothetical protein
MIKNDLIFLNELKLKLSIVNKEIIEEFIIKQRLKKEF